MEDYRILNADEVVRDSDEVELQMYKPGEWTTSHGYKGMVVSECIGRLTKKQITFRRKVEKQMFYRISNRSDLHAGEIVKYVENIRTYLKVKTQEGKTVTADPKYLTPIKVKVTKTLVSPASKLISILEDDGYVIDCSGWWSNKGKPGFGGEMFKYIGKELPSYCDSNPNWFEEKWEEIKPEVNYKKFVVDFMKLKRELSHPSYLYERDIDEIMEQWSEEECKSIYEKFKDCTFEPNFGSYWCPFCIKYKIACSKCSYGARHGLCNHKGSDFLKYMALKSKDLSKLSEFIKNS